MGLAEAFGGIAASMSAAFGGPFIEGAATWSGTPTQDSGGSITDPGSPFSAACQVQIDTATEEMRRDADFLAGDVRLIITGLSALDTAARVTAAGKTYALRSVTRDPLGLGYECRARPCP